MGEPGSPGSPFGPLPQSASLTNEQADKEQMSSPHFQPTYERNIAIEYQTPLRVPGGALERRERGYREVAILYRGAGKSDIEAEHPAIWQFSGLNEDELDL